MNNKNNQRKTIRYVSMIIINQEVDRNLRNKKFMWLSKRENPYKAMFGYMQCPGGHIEENEDPEEAIVREMKEETDLNIIHKWKDLTTFVIENDQDREKGRKEITIFEYVTDQLPIQTELENNSEWKLYNFEEILNMKIIDSVQEYMRIKVQQLIMEKSFILLEGTIGTGKTFVSQKFNSKWKRIPEVAISEEMEPYLEKFVKKQITTFQFQQLLEKQYNHVICNEILFNENEYLLLDRFQKSTKIFAIFNELQTYEILELKKNEIITDEIVKKSLVIFIETSRDQMLQNVQKRARQAEKDYDKDYLKLLHGAYEWIFRKVYKDLPTQIITIENNRGKYKNNQKILQRIRKIEKAFE